VSFHAIGLPLLAARVAHPNFGGQRHQGYKERFDDNEKQCRATQEEKQPDLDGILLQVGMEGFIGLVDTADHMS